jgi:large subunit ribosomal protein L6
MSRVAKDPIPLPKGVEVKLNGRDLTVKGSKGTLALSLAEGIKISQDESIVNLAP